WLSRTPDVLINEGKSEAYCKWCKSTIRPKIDALRDHIKTKTHQDYAKSLPSSSQPQLVRYGYRSSASQKTEEKKAELKLAVMVGCHASTKCIDHISEVLQKLGTGSALSELRLHRTKCSKLMERVIKPALVDDLMEDVGGSFYSVIVDESTDHSFMKLMAMVIKHYSKKNKKMILTPLGLVETPRADAENLYRAFTAFFASLGLKLNKLLALGTDGGLNMCGPYNSLYAYLKQRHCPHLMLVRCTCHSLDKAASHASKTLSNSVDALRKYEYAQLHKEMFGCMPPLLIKLAPSRWLSFYGAVKTHLAQYEARSALFNKVVQEAKDDKDICLTAKTLAQLHNDGTNLLYLTFLKPVLEQLTGLNLLFQRTDADLCRAFSDLRVFVFSIAGRVVKDEALRQTAQPGMLRVTELQALRNALSKQDSLEGCS
ncbi:Zinc finger MYM-type protein 1, partial [Frankliniella fusca]